MAVGLIRVFCRACEDAAHQRQTPSLYSRLQNSPNTSQGSTRLAGLLGDSPRVARRPLALMLVMSASDPAGQLRAFIVEGSSHGRGPRSDSGSLSHPSEPSQGWVGSPSQSPPGRGPDDGDVDLTRRRRTPLQRSSPLGWFSLPPVLRCPYPVLNRAVAACKTLAC